jgi:glycyl-tRNA synthetase beta chain
MAFAAGLEVVEDKGLLAEVAGLVEWPVVLMGEIGADFLDLPPEVLQTSMKEHQKFFSVRNPKTGGSSVSSLLPIGKQRITAPRSSREIRRFCRRACRMRNSSGRTTCAWRRPAWALAGGAEIRDLRAAAGLRRRPGGADRRAGRRDRARWWARRTEAATAARIAKADLHSEMVYEFPELQGVMGRYYAEAAGHPPEIAAVAEEHYGPSAPPTTCRPRPCRSPWRWPRRSTR